MSLIPTLALAWVVVVALLALVAWDETPATVEPPDPSRGRLAPDAYARKDEKNARIEAVEKVERGA